MCSEVWECVVRYASVVRSGSVVSVVRSGSVASVVRSGRVACPVEANESKSGVVDAPHVSHTCTRRTKTYGNNSFAGLKNDLIYLQDKSCIPTTPISRILSKTPMK